MLVLVRFSKALAHRNLRLQEGQPLTELLWWPAASRGGLSIHLIEQKIRSPNCTADISNAQQPDAATATGPRTGRGTLPSTQGALLGNAVLKTRHPSYHKKTLSRWKELKTFLCAATNFRLSVNEGAREWTHRDAEDPRGSALPSPSSLMDFGWETAKHCIVSYFWCASWWSWPSSSESGKGFTSIRQLNVWLFRLGGSPDQDPPFTEQGKSGPKL